MLELRNIRFAYGDDVVLDDIDLTVNEQDIVCLLGPSGCGKTTLLRVIAGLEPDYSGQVKLHDDNLHGTPVHERGFGLMFQDFALFPHMTVLDNVAFGLKMDGVNKRDRQKRAFQMLETVGLSTFSERDVTSLSGGEKQRVALARSLAPEPRLLMLDEPLGSLDANLREQLVVELRQIIHDVGLTSVYVTHDQQEAYAIADTIAIMNDGRIEQIGTPEDVYRQPRTAFVARFLNLDNIVSPHFLPDELQPSDNADEILLHPDGIALAASPDAGQISAEVIECVFQGATYRLLVESDGTALTFSIPARGEIPAVGDRVTLTIEADAVIPLMKRR